MKNKNIFIEIGTDYHNENTPIISDGRYYFALGDYINGTYVACVEVADKYGYCKDNDSHFEDFEPFYEENNHGEKILKGYRML